MHLQRKVQDDLYFNMVTRRLDFTNVVDVGHLAELVANALEIEKDKDYFIEGFSERFDGIVKEEMTVWVGTLFFTPTKQVYPSITDFILTFFSDERDITLFFDEAYSLLYPKELLN